jgi:hypothetical protein
MHSAFGWLVNAGKQANRRGFPAATGADEAKNRTTGDIQIYFADNRLLAYSFRQIFAPNDWSICFRWADHDQTRSFASVTPSCSAQCAQQ